MKRLTALLASLALALCLLTPALALAETQTAQAPIPDYCKPILEQWNAETAEELYQNLLTFYGTVVNPGEEKNYTVKRYPMKIRFGGTTKELIADKKSWGMAIVSSKDVDVEKLIEKGVILRRGFSPIGDSLLKRWLLPQNVQAFLPEDLYWDYAAYVYDYDAKTDDATLILFNAKNRGESTIIREMLEARSAEQVRALEGICYVQYWTPEQLLAQPDDWDIATLTITSPDQLTLLDEAGLLYDYNQHSVLASHPAPYLSGYREMTKGFFSADGRWIAMTYTPTSFCDPENAVEVLLVNAKSPYTARALEYAVQFVKGHDMLLEPDFPFMGPATTERLVKLGLLAQ